MKRKITSEELNYELTNQIWNISILFGDFIPVYFLLLKVEKTQIRDEFNYSGNVIYSIDTDYGGGPATVFTTFSVNDGILSVNLSSIDFQGALDFEEINANMSESDEIDEEDWN